MTDTKPVVSLNLDDLEREDRPEPYLVELGGRVYTLQDPTELDYRKLMEAFRAADNGRPELAVEVIIADDDERAAFFDNPMPTWKLEKLFDGYTKHFGLSGKAPAAGRGSGGSKPSSRGTGKR